MAEGTRARLATQARLRQARKTDAPSYKLRAPEPGKGYDLLPAPQSGDLCDDIEGDPHCRGGLVDLHGLWCNGQFRAFWAHHHAGEVQALSGLPSFFRAWLETLPSVPIQHSAAQEITALRRLTPGYGIGEALPERLPLTP